MEEGVSKLLQAYQALQALSFEAKRAIIGSCALVVIAAYLHIAGRNKKEPSKQLTRKKSA